jgi:hypothetical protein
MIGGPKLQNDDNKGSKLQLSRKNKRIKIATKKLRCNWRNHNKK